MRATERVNNTTDNIRTTNIQPPFSYNLVPVITIVIAVFAAFQAALYNDFVNWDDLQNLVQNSAYRGFSPEHIRWMITTTYGGHYQPLSWLSYAFDFQFWGLSPTGYHLTNLLLHLITSITFFVIARCVLPLIFSDATDRVLAAGSLLATLLFAIHPLRVESVVWATERRDVLSGAFLMLTILFYFKSHTPSQNSKAKTYFTLAIGSYILSLFSKAAGITLPVLLLILDIYPLRRLSCSKPSENLRSSTQATIFIEKLYFLIPAVIIAWIALLAQSKSGALWGLDAHPLVLRIAQAFYGILFYPVKTLWPANLIPLYEQRPDASAYELIYIASAVCVIGITVLFWKLRRRVPSLLTCWTIYIITLSPMLGIAQSGPQVVADRYSYLSCIPWALLGGGMLIQILEKFRNNNSFYCVTIAIALLIPVTLGYLTRSQTKIWRDSYTLWTTTLERAPNTPTAHTNLAVVLNSRGEFQRAIKHSLEALTVLPDNRHAHITLAHASAAMEDFKTAERHSDIALDITQSLGKTDPDILTQAIYVKARLGKDDEAWRLFQLIQEHEHYRVTQKIVRAAESMAAGMAERGDFDQAAKLLEDTIQFNPGVLSEPVQSRIKLQIARYKEGKTLRE